MLQRNINRKPRIAAPRRPAGRRRPPRPLRADASLLSSHQGTSWFRVIVLLCSPFRSRHRGRRRLCPVSRARRRQCRPGPDRARRAPGRRGRSGQQVHRRLAALFRPPGSHRPGRHPPAGLRHPDRRALPGRHHRQEGRCALHHRPAPLRGRGGPRRRRPDGGARAALPTPPANWRAASACWATTPSPAATSRKSRTPPAKPPPTCKAPRPRWTTPG